MLGFDNLLSAQSILDTQLLVPFELIEAKPGPGEAFKVQHLDSAYLAKMQTHSLADVIEQKTPMFIKRYGNGGLASVSFRGTNASHTGVYWNGLKVNSPTLGMLDFSLLSINLVDEVEIQYGAASQIAGSGGLGGSILLKNTPKFSKGFQYSITQDLASFHTYNTSIKVGYSNAKWAFETSLNGNWSKNDFTYNSIYNGETQIEDQASYSRKGAQQAIFYKPNGKSALKLIGHWSELQRTLPPIITVDRNAEQMTDNAGRILFEWNNHQKKVSHAFSAGMIKNANNYTNQIAQIDSKNNSLSLLTNYWITTNAFNNIKLSGNIQAGSEHARSSGFDGNVSRTQFSSFLGANYINNSEVVYLNASAREQVNDNSFSPLQPAVGMKLKLLNGIYSKSSVSKTVNFPSLNDLYWIPSGNPDLIPEESVGVEQGVSIEKVIGVGNYKTELTTYYNIIDNWILWSPGTFGYWTPKNLKQVETKGFELEMSMRGDVGDVYFGTFATYAYVSAKNLAAYGLDSSIVGNQVIYVPKHQLKAGCNMKWNQLEVSYSHQFMGNRFISTDNYWYMPFYNVGSLYIGYNLAIEKYRSSLRLSCNNIWNEDYQSMPYRPLPRRNYALTFSLNFN